MSDEKAMNQLEILMKHCGLPNTTDSHGKYIEKIRDLFSQISQHLSLKIKAVEEGEQSGLVDESLELISDDFENLSAENKEKAIATIIEKCAHQQAAITKQKELLESFSKLLEMLSALERLYQMPLKLVCEFQATFSAVELKFQSDVDRLNEILELLKPAKSLCLNDQIIVEPEVMNWNELQQSFEQLTADLQKRSSSSGPWSGFSQLQAAIEGLRLVEAEREEVLQKFAVLESWRKMQESSLQVKKQELCAHFTRLELNEKIMTACISFLTEQISMLEDLANFKESHAEYAQMQIETIKLELLVL